MVSVVSGLGVGIELGMELGMGFNFYVLQPESARNKALPSRNFREKTNKTNV